MCIGSYAPACAPHAAVLYERYLAPFSKLQLLLPIGTWYFLSIYKTFSGVTQSNKGFLVTQNQAFVTKDYMVLP